MQATAAPPSETSASEPAPEPVHAATEEHASFCANCGADQIGEFCHECGQHYLEGGRLTLRHLWQEVTLRLLRLERGLPHTVWSLFTRPGEVARRFVHGERRRYTNPLTYFFIACTLALIGYEIVEGPLVELMSGQIHEQMADRQQDSDNPDVMALIFPGEDPAAEYATFIFGIIQRAYSYLQLLLVIPLAFALKLFFRTRETDYNFAELMVPSFYLVAQFTIVGTLMQPIAFTMQSYTLFGIGVALFGLLYIGWGLMQFFERRGAVAALLATLSFVLAYAVYFCFMMLLIILSVAWRAYQAAQTGAFDSLG